MVRLQGHWEADLDTKVRKRERVFIKKQHAGSHRAFALMAVVQKLSVTKHSVRLPKTRPARDVKELKSLGNNSVVRY